MTDQSIGFTFTPATGGQGAGKIADAVLFFLDGPMAGLKMEGLSVWTSKFGPEGSVNVLMPSRPGQPKPDGKKSYYDLLRPADPVDKKALFSFKDFVIAEFEKWRKASAEPRGSGFALDGGEQPAEEIDESSIPF